MQELERELTTTKRALTAAQRATPATSTRTVEVEVVKPATVKAIERAIDRSDAAVARVNGLVVNLRAHVEAAQARGAELVQTREALVGERRAIRVGRPGVQRETTPPRSPSPHRGGGPGDPDVGGGGLRRILIALAQRPQGLTLRQIGVRAGLSSRSGTFSTYMSRGRQRGWICDGGPGGASTITDAGLQALGKYEPLPTGAELLEYWLRELGESGAARILRAVAEAYPEALPLEEVGKRAELNARSGTFSTYLSRLRTLELIEGRGTVRASEELFG
jgi:hypothetical protein